MTTLNLTFTAPAPVALTENGSALTLTFPAPQAVTLSAVGMQGPGGGSGGGVTDGDKGDITVSASGASWIIDAGAVSLSKMADLAASTILGRASAGTGAPEALTAAQVRTVLNVANGATANAADAVLLARANHTGTQAASTITGLAAVATSGSAADLTAGVLPAARFDDTAHGARAGGTLHAVATGAAAGFLSAADKTKLDAITGTNTGDQTISLTGDVTGSGTGSFAATIAANAVGFTKLADIATDTLIGRDTAGTGDPEAITVTGGIEFSGTGAIRTSAFTGDVTKAAGGTALTVAANAVDNTKAADMAANTIKANATAAAADPGDLAVGTNSVVGRVAGNIVAAQLVDAQVAAATLTNAKLANVATATLKGRATAGTGSPEDLTGTQVTALLDTFTSALKGLAPASGGGTTNFLRADGTWAAPAGGGGGTPGGTTGAMQYNNAGAFAGAANVQVEGDELRLPAIATPTAPAAGGVKLYGYNLAGRITPAYITPAGFDTTLQVALGGNKIFMVTPATGTTAPNVTGGTLTTAVTMSYQWTASNTNVWDAHERKRFTSAATAGTMTGCRTANQAWYLSSTAGYGGFLFRARFGQNINLNGGQMFVGLCNLATALAGDPSALVTMCGMGYDAADASTGNWQFMRNDGSGTATKVDLGANAARNTSHGYELVMRAAPGAAELFVRVINLTTNTVVLDTSYTTDIPAANQPMAFKAECRNGAVASAVALDLALVYIEKDY